GGVGRGEGEGGTGVWRDWGGGVVSEELVEVVEIASGLRSHVGDIQCLPVYLVAAGDLKLTIKISSAAGQRQQASARRHLRIYNQVINRVALLIRHANQQVLQHLAVNFNIPRPAARVS